VFPIGPKTTFGIIYFYNGTLSTVTLHLFYKSWVFKKHLTVFTNVKVKTSHTFPVDTCTRLKTPLQTNITYSSTWIASQPFFTYKRFRWYLESPILFVWWKTIFTEDGKSFGLVKNTWQINLCGTHNTVRFEFGRHWNLRNLSFRKKSFHQQMIFRMTFLRIALDAHVRI